MKIIKGFITAILFCISYSTFGQTRLTLSNHNPVTLEVPHIYNSSDPKPELRDDSQWINFTSLVGAADPNMSVSVQIVSGTLPQGMDLVVEVLPYRGLSKTNQQGTPTSKVIASYTPQVIISNIGTCFTGNGRNEGFQVIYTFVIRDYSRLSSGSESIYLQYTIMQ